MNKFYLHWDLDNLNYFYFLFVEIKKEGKKQCNDIQKRIDDLEKELNMYKSMYEREKIDYEEIYKRNYVGDNELEDVIKDLYEEIMYLENRKIYKKDIINITRAVRDIKKLIINKFEHDAILKCLKNNKGNVDEAFYELNKSNKK